MTSTLQVVDAEGDFNSNGVESFAKEASVEVAGQHYTVVAIMGPQSSGKSTLLNHVFGTRFDEMDALEGRHQTTRGIWLAASPKVRLPPTLVMDLEGSDGRERGEDDTSFERQSALFALATADVLLINMWAKDVGREFGAGKPLLKTIFQVNLKLFRPAPGARRTVLLFVFRDRTRTPLEKLRDTWQADLERMWAAIAKPPAYETSTVDDFFDVQYAALSNYEERPEDFSAEATLLRGNFSEDAAEGEGYLRSSATKLPGAALALSMSKVWEVIRENKDLNLPAHRVMVANIRCKEIAEERLATFEASEAWQAIGAEAAEDLLPRFGTRVGGLMQSALDAYDAEARYFDGTVSGERRVTLETELLMRVEPAFHSQLSLASALALESFKECMSSASSSSAPSSPGFGASARSRHQQQQSPGQGETFVERARRCGAAAMAQFDAIAEDVLVPSTPWTPEKARGALERAVAAHHADLKATHVGASLKSAESVARKGVSAGTMPLFEAPPADLWRRLSAVVEREATAAVATLGRALEGYGVAPNEEADLFAAVRGAARGMLLANAKEAANTALPRMKDRFAEVFQKDEGGMPRAWAPSVDVAAVALEARRAAATLLAQLCFARESHHQPAAAPGRDAIPATTSGGGGGGGLKPNDAVESAVLRLAAGERGGASAAAAQRDGKPGTHGNGEFDLLSASEWPGVPQDCVLLTPAQARTVWKQFASDTALSVQQAVATQEANRLAQNRLPPVWALIAMVVLGFNEAMAVLRNPFLLLSLIFLLAFAKTVYEKLEVEREMQRGLLPGAMAIWAKFMPTVRSVVLDTIESGRTLVEGQLSGTGETPEQRRGRPFEDDEDGGGGQTYGGRHLRFEDAMPGGEGLRARRREIEMATPANGGRPRGILGGDLLSRKDE